MAQDPYRYFRVEARELLEQLGKGIMDLEKGLSGPDSVSRTLRLAHTLKGAARVVRQSEVADLAHAIEDALTPFRENGGAVPRDRTDAILKLIDEMTARVAALAPPPSVEAGLAGSPTLEESFRTVRADITEINALLDGVAEAHVNLVSLRTCVESLERARHLAALLSEQLSVPRIPNLQRPGNGIDPAKVKSTAEELRQLLVAVGRGLNGGAAKVDRELRQIRDAAERLRLLPTGVLFHALERAVRDAAQTLGKHVRFEGRGGDVRLDAHAINTVQGAMIQLARNAVAHGIELESERRAAGKPPEGTVSIEVVRRGNRVAFVCRDDGRGIDLDAVRRAAQRRGLISSETQDFQSEELLRLLLKGGITTSGAVTEVSGRGIGLDVVREAADRLGGDVRVDTRVGGGTTVEILIPVSLALLSALVVEASGIAAAIPLDAVLRVHRVAANEIAHTAEGDAIFCDGKVVPFMSLADAVARAAGGSPTSRACSAVVVRGETRVAAVGVDRLLGTASILLRPLPELAPADPVVAGVSLDPEGNPQIVLDPEALVARAHHTERPASALQTPSTPLLIIDDSLTTRMLEQSILESAGYEVDLAASGEEALEKARQRRYGLFLVDVEMPGMDGFTFLERTRDDALLRDTPAIMVTSRCSAEDRRRGVEAGARSFIVKSEFDQTEFLDRIRSLVA